MTSLSYLYLQSNQLNGPIPSELGSLVLLFRLFLQDNMLVGPVPSSIANLVNLSSDFVDIGDNALYTDDPALTSFMNSMDPDWAASQTVTPLDIAAEAIDHQSVRITWTPISFIDFGGGYRIYYRTDPAGVDPMTA